MKSLAVKLITGFGVAGATGTAVAGVWYLNSPKDVKSKLVSEGLTLVGNSGKAWRAMFLTHKDDAEFVRFADLTNVVDAKIAGPKVLAACKKALGISIGVEEYDFYLLKARKYCTTPVFNTVEATVLFSDKEISSSERDWKDIFTLHKSDTFFINKVKAANQGSALEISTPVENAKSLVQKFCNDLKSKDPNSGNISNYEKYCLQTPINIQGFYKEQGYTLIGGGGWGSRFMSSKDNDTFLIDDIKAGTSLDKSSSADVGGPKLKEWCDKERVKEINQVSDIQKVRNRCFN